MQEGNYFVAKNNLDVFIKMTGNLKYTNSTGFDNYLKKILTGDFNNILIDLTEAEYIDSTNLGLIAGISETLREKNGKKVTLVSPNTEINKVLLSVCFDRVFTMVNNLEIDEVLKKIPDIKKDERETAEMMLKAHKNLISISCENKNIFQDVVKMMENELKQ